MTSPPSPPPWTVFRHSGRGSSPEAQDGWREIFSGPEDKARMFFHEKGVFMRQGGIRLVKPDGSTDSERHAPRLRTSW